MPPPPRQFRLVYRAFDRIEFSRAKSDEVLEARGFDLAYIGQIFPGYVLERQDTRSRSETRYQAIGELLGEVYFLAYTRRGNTCRLITAWAAEPSERELWNGITF